MIRTGRPKMCTSCPPKEWTCREDWARADRNDRAGWYFELRDRRGHKPAYRDYEQRVEATMRAARARIQASCSDPVAANRGLEGIVVIDASGAPADLVLEEDRWDVSCLEGGLKALHFPPPPKAPFQAKFSLPGANNQ